jgi:proline iminopeptidase
MHGAMKCLSLFLCIGFTGCSAQTPPASPLSAPLKNGEFTAKLNGLDLSYKVSGVGPVALFPGPAAGPSGDLYASSLKPFEKFFTVVYLQTRGSGRSQKPATLKEYRFADFTADLEALRQHLQQDQVWLIGHSLGGVLVLQYAIAHPNHSAGLIIMDSLPAIADKEHLSDMDARLEERKDKPWFKEAKAAGETPPNTIKDDEEFKATVARNLPMHFYDVSNIEKNKHHFADSFSLAAARGVEASNPPTLELLPLNRITASALVLVGSHDVYASPRQAERIHLGIARSKLIVIEKAGHFPWLEQPERFFAAVTKGLETLGVEPAATQ